ncbi:MAG: M56 family metallopeptidase [Lachnospiraceae bacterium]|nr:M56 family metallopeptidase [Lachnospiraceae bacterium]
MGLLHRSLTGALLVLVILLVRAVAVNRLPKAAFKALWAVAAARLLLPFSVASRFSLYNIAAKLAGSGPVDELHRTGQMPAGWLADGAAKPDGMFGGVSVTGAIYFLGVCVLACCFLFSYLSCWRKFRVSIPVRHKAAEDWLEKKSCGKAGFFALGRCRRKPEIRVSDRISSPLTYGILRPVILLPKRMDWEDERALGYILDHEYVHILHFDALNKVIFAVMLCVHWFNPLVWGMYFFANRDMELYCDETVVRMGGESAKESYALALLRVE